MKIEIEYPFSLKYKSAYLVSSQGRNTVVLFNSSRDRTSISYARYLLSVKEKRFLKEEEHVDHINDDKADDRVENLQILTAKENNVKASIAAGGVGMARLKCPVCGTIFAKPKRLIASKETASCSRVCGYKLSSREYRGSVKKIVLEEYKSIDHLVK